MPLLNFLFRNNFFKKIMYISHKETRGILYVETILHLGYHLNCI